MPLPSKTIILRCTYVRRRRPPFGKGRRKAMVSIAFGNMLTRNLLSACHGAGEYWWLLWRSLLEQAETTIAGEMWVSEGNRFKMRLTCLACMHIWTDEQDQRLWSICLERMRHMIGKDASVVFKITNACFNGQLFVKLSCSASRTQLSPCH
jgi:hypothetical protein